MDEQKVQLRGQECAVDMMRKPRGPRPLLISKFILGAWTAVSILIVGHRAATAREVTAKVCLRVLADQGTEILSSSIGACRVSAFRGGPPDSIAHDFRVRNDGASPVTVQRLETSCGCTSAVADGNIPRVLSPGQDLAVHCTLNLNGLQPGIVLKTVGVYLEGAKSPSATLQFCGVIAARCSLMPATVDFGPVLAGTHRALMARLRYTALPTPGSHVHLSCDNPDVLLDPEYFLVRGGSNSAALTEGTSNSNALVPIPEERFFVRLSPRARPGPAIARLNVFFEVPGSNVSVSELTVPVSWRIVRDLEPDPITIELGTVLTVTGWKGTARSERLTLQGFTSNALAGLRIQCGWAVGVTAVIPGLSSPINAANGKIVVPDFIPDSAVRTLALDVALARDVPDGDLDSEVTLTTRKGLKITVPVHALIVRADASLRAK